MSECTHKWRYYTLHKHDIRKFFINRECKLCVRKEHREYLGGGMWEWKKISE